MIENSETEKHFHVHAFHSRYRDYITNDEAIKWNEKNTRRKQRISGICVCFNLFFHISNRIITSWHVNSISIFVYAVSWALFLDIICSHVTKNRKTLIFLKRKKDKIKWNFSTFFHRLSRTYEIKSLRLLLWTQPREWVILKIYTTISSEESSAVISWRLTWYHK